MGTTTFLSVIIVLLLVPITNIILLIPILIFLFNKRLDLKELIVFIVLFIIEILLLIFTCIAPIKDGGIFMQAFLVEIAGILVITRQVSLLRRVQKSDDGNTITK